MEKIDQRLLRFIRTGEGDFDALALDVFAHQFSLNAPYRAYARQTGKTPETVKTWKDIPAVSVTAFKSVELATFPVSQAAAHFQSSGTTRQIKSHHYLKTLTYYETALKAGFDKAVLPDHAKLPFFILTPSPAEAPRSSLSWMMDVVRRQCAAAGSSFFIARGRLDELSLLAGLGKAQADQQSIVLLGTTIAFMGLFDVMEKNKKAFSLAPGSRLMDTGGMKTQKRDLHRPEFVRLVEERLGIPAAQCINEYGMCELSSQFYGRGPESYLEGPAWTRTLVIDPLTGLEAAAGQPGLLRHFDLANVDSILAIQAEDEGIAQGAGFVLRGRASDAEVRGCSVSADAFVHG